jgi:hypothetical protein
MQQAVRGGTAQNAVAAALGHCILSAAVKDLPMGVLVQHQTDLARGGGWVELPDALARKYPGAGRD